MQNIRSSRWTHVQERRYARSVDVRVEDTSSDAASCGCQRQVDGDGAFAHATFRAADGHHFGDIGYWALFGKAWLGSGAVYLLRAQG